MAQAQPKQPPQLGVVRGKGTATSDSIPAKLSKGEMVIPAAVVKHYGAAYFTKLMQSVNPELGTQTTVKKGVVQAAKSARYDANGRLIKEPAAQPAIKQPAAQFNPDYNKVYSGNYPALADANSVQTERIPANDYYPKGAASANPNLGAQNFTTQSDYPGTIPQGKALSPVPKTVTSSPDAWANEGSSVSGKSVLSNVGKGISKGLGTLGAVGSVLGLADLAAQTSERDKYLQARGRRGDEAATQALNTGGSNPATEAVKRPIRENVIAPIEKFMTTPLWKSSAQSQTTPVNRTASVTPPPLAQKPVIAGTPTATTQPGVKVDTAADETQIPYLGAKGQKYISNPDGSNTTITNANRPSNRVVDGLPVTMASESIAANGDRNYVIPGENGNASRLGIHQTGTDARGNGNFDVSYGKGQHGTVSASPELMQRYRENKGSFGVADMSKVPHYQEPQQQAMPQQQARQAPQLQGQDYSAQINELMAQMPEASRFDSIGDSIAKKQQRKAIEAKLNTLTGLQNSSNQQTLEAARLGAHQNQYNQSRQDDQTRDARTAKQQQWTNAKEASAVDYLHERNLKADEAATAKAQADANLENRKFGQNKYGAIRNPDTNEITTYAEQGPAADEAFKQSQQARMDARTQNAQAILNDKNASPEQIQAAKAWLARKL